MTEEYNDENNEALPRDKEGNIVQYFPDEVEESQKSLWIPVGCLIFAILILSAAIKQAL